MQQGPIISKVDENGIGHIILNRPEKHNAIDIDTIDAITGQLKRWWDSNEIRLLCLSANGANFSTGADLNWMRQMAKYSEAENVADAKKLAGMLRLLYTFPKPSLALIRGATFGGGLGLIACCDVAVADSEASFCFSETRIGLMPASISPFVIKALGPRIAKKLFLTAEQFSAGAALHYGLIHHIFPLETITMETTNICKQILANGPEALKDSKTLVHEVQEREIDHHLLDEVALKIARSRASEEGQEGIHAFLHKRPPAWQAPTDDEA